MNTIKKLCTLGAVVGGIMLSGCTSLQNVYPRTSIQAPMDRSDYCILETVRGISETRSYFFGIFKVINNKAIKRSDQSQDTVVLDSQYSQFMGIGEQPARYAFVKTPNAFERIFLGPSTEDRAYYNALSVLPEEADAVLNKAYFKEVLRNIPGIYKHDVTEFKGKAIRLKTDQDLNAGTSCVRIKRDFT